MVGEYDVLLFESHVYKEPWKAMMEFDFHEPSHNDWFATMRMMKHGKIIEEDLFDTSAIRISLLKNRRVICDSEQYNVCDFANSNITLPTFIE